jgi:two-component system LytT family response regulator
MMRVLIVDDEPAARERLEVLLKQVTNVEIVGSAFDGESALAAVDALKPDLILLDIQMPDLNGLTVASRLPVENRPEIIFVTAFEIYAADAFEVEAVDYLLKPVRFDRLRQAMERAGRRRELGARPPAVAREMRSIWVETRTGSVRVPIGDIEWIEAAKDYVLLHTATRSFLHRSTMTAMERQLADTDLVRVHRSAFVRLDRVTAVEGRGRWITALVIAGDLEIPVGPSYGSDVFAALNASSANPVTRAP